MEIIVQKHHIVCKYGQGATAVIDRACGNLLRISQGGMELPVAALSFDVGVDGEYVNRTFVFESFLEFNTWSLPTIIPNMGCEKNLRFMGYRVEDEAVVIRYMVNALAIDLYYEEHCDMLRVWLKVQNISNQKLWINGTALSLELSNEWATGTSFDFPGNVPYGSYKFGRLQTNRPVQTALVNAVSHLEKAGEHLNLIYINSDEKWGTGVFKTANDDLCWTALAATEICLEPEESYTCGHMYIQPIGKGDRFEPIRTFYQTKGWNPPTDGIKEAVIYSCHPAGAWDAKPPVEGENGQLHVPHPAEEPDTIHPLHHTMAEYAKYLDRLAAMNIDIIWLLPLFDHFEEGDPTRNAYTPTDQAIIDKRYGTNEDVKSFVGYAFKRLTLLRTMSSGSMYLVFFLLSPSEIIWISSVTISLPKV